MAAYTEAQIKAAFWKAFHKCGEVWFNYVGTEEQCESSTQESWRDFEEALAGQPSEPQAPPKPEAPDIEVLREDQDPRRKR